MRVKESTLRRIIREEASRALHEADAAQTAPDLTSPDRVWSSPSDPGWAQAAGRSLQAAIVASDLIKMKSIIDGKARISDPRFPGTPYYLLQQALDASSNNFKDKASNSDFAVTVKQTIDKFQSAAPEEQFRHIVYSMSTQTVAVSTDETDRKVWSNPTLSLEILKAIAASVPFEKFIADVKAWYTGPLTPNAGATAPAPAPIPPKPKAAPIQDWPGYIRKTPNGGQAVAAAWKAYAAVAGQDPGFPAFETWWRGMQKNRGQYWKGDPVNVAAQLNAATKLKTPPAGAVGSVPAGVPGQAVAAESFKRVINILNENNHRQLKNLKIRWGK